MARFDGSGPNGAGPMSGKGMGFCAGNVVDRPIYCRGMGRRNRRFDGQARGMGRQVGNGPYGRGMARYYTDEAEYILDPKDLLEEEKAALEKRLARINSELNNLDD